MNEQITLAIKYRPKEFSEVCGQQSIKTIIENQLNTNTFKHSYLFTGPAGCGKTTCARIFAKEINKGLGNAIEMDAASNSGVDDVREIISQAKTQSLDSEYKVFIIDECHSISNTGWQAFLKLIEEPPLKSIFIFCTTNPEKIPKTILSRVQRYDFSRLPNNIILSRLKYVCKEEDIKIKDDALNFIVYKANGGMRDALTLLDKVRSFSSNEIDLDSASNALGIVSYSTMYEIIKDIIEGKDNSLIETLERLYLEGIDLKSFIYDLILFTLDLNKYKIFNSSQVIPENILKDSESISSDKVLKMLQYLLKLNNEIKYNNNPLYYIESYLLCLRVEF